jgi:hypothetical protein
MTPTVAEILQSIEALSLREQQEIVISLCDRVVINEPLESRLGVDSIFRTLDLAAKRDVLRQKLLSGLEQGQLGARLRS